MERKKSHLKAGPPCSREELDAVHTLRLLPGQTLSVQEDLHRHRLLKQPPQPCQQPAQPIHLINRSYLGHAIFPNIALLKLIQITDSREKKKKASTTIQDDIMIYIPHRQSPHVQEYQPYSVHFPSMKQKSPEKQNIKIYKTV